VNPAEMLRTVKTVLVIDWPSKDVPETLARAGLYVVVRGGPKPADHAVYEVREGKVTVRPLGRPPEQADLVYAYRPPDELANIVATAKALHAKAIWSQSGLTSEGIKDPKGCWLPEAQLRAARDLVELAGLVFISEPYICDPL